MQSQDSTLIEEKNNHKTVYAILFTISFSHFLNDLIQAIIPAIYPLIKQKFRFSYTQIGIITLTFQLTASILQPFIGNYTDKKARPFSLAIGMVLTAIGLVLLSRAGGFYAIIIAASMIGMGSSIFHPESSRVAHLASGGKKGLAQSIFQLGGNAGSSLGPLLAALIIVPNGQENIIWFTFFALLGFIILLKVGKWYQQNLHLKQLLQKKQTGHIQQLSKKKVKTALSILLVLIFSKYFYMTSLTNYFTFFLIEKFQLTVQQSQMYLFLFLAAVALGTIIGGPLGDKFGRKYIIWISILGSAPFALLLPYANLFFTGILIALIGLIIASAFSAILVYATDLIPGKVGMIAGLFFGFAFGIAGIGSAILGWLADQTSIFYVYKICSFLPLIGIVTGFLPNIESKRKW